MRLIAIPLISTLLLTGCAGAQKPVAVKCPKLAAPPEVVVEKLAEVARENADAGAWVIGLEKHYRKLEVCAS